MCRSRCYAWKISEGRRIFERAEKNDRIWEREDRVKLICGAIMDAGISWLRIHDIGDFKSPEDVNAWCEIAQKCRRIHFWAYTRSWKFNRFIEPLKQFAALPNVDLLFSADRAMPDPPRIDGISISWLADTDGDEPSNHVEVVFRGTNERSREEDERRKARKSSGALSLPVIGHHRNLTHVRSMKGAPVCPHQTGHEIKPAYQDCVSCCLCMPKARDRRASSIAVVRIETKQTADERIAQESAA
ncbi:MAG: hypothetical protein KDA54_00225 [Phycisphaerales bacterium]|nr:hypothetical protein [Phycisphaerales bacterium]